MAWRMALILFWFWVRARRALFLYVRVVATIWAVIAKPPAMSPPTIEGVTASQFIIHIRVFRFRVQVSVSLLTQWQLPLRVDLGWRFHILQVGNVGPTA